MLTQLECNELEERRMFYKRFNEYLNVKNEEIRLLKKMIELQEANLRMNDSKKEDKKNTFVKGR